MASQQESLTKIIQQAIAKGWTELGSDVWVYEQSDKSRLTVHMGNKAYDVEHVIFNPGFGKALWGEHDIPAYASEWYCPKCGDYQSHYEHDAMSGSCWEFHLMQMVIVDDRIKYLEEHYETV